MTATEDIQFEVPADLADAIKEALEAIEHCQEMADAVGRICHRATKIAEAHTVHWTDERQRDFWKQTSWPVMDAVDDDLCTRMRPWGV